ncbi:MAG: hypothetical protein ABI306_10600 [Caulobacteraceae bacterium]
MALPVPAAPPAGTSGLPQFDPAQWPGQIVWVLIVFAVLYVLFAKVFVPSVGGAIDAREAKIAGDIAEARRLKGEAEAQAKAAAGEMDEARENARQVAAGAKAQAKTAAAGRRAEEAGRLAKGFEEAEARIAATKGEAMGHVRTIAADTARAMIERLTGAAATGGEVERALGAPAAQA